MSLYDAFLAYKLDSILSLLVLTGCPLDLLSSFPNTAVFSYYILFPLPEKLDTFPQPALAGLLLQVGWTLTKHQDGPLPNHKYGPRWHHWLTCPQQPAQTQALSLP